MKINWSSRKFLINEIYENAANPRKISRESGNQLRRSLEKFGLCEPIVVNQNGLIIGGHQRYRLLQTMGQYEIDCFVPDRLLSNEEVQELTIRLNKNGGEWDFDILANEWDTNELIDWGFTEKELGLKEDQQITTPNPVTIAGDSFLIKFSTNELMPAQCDALLDQISKMVNRFKSKIEMEKNGEEFQWLIKKTLS